MTTTSRGYSLLTKYGISEDDVRLMLAHQFDRCAICSTYISAPGKHFVDHDHASGRIRGLLCSQCNTGLGMFKDSVRLLAGAIVYLQSNGTEDQATQRELRT